MIEMAEVFPQLFVSLSKLFDHNVNEGNEDRDIDRRR